VTRAVLVPARINALAQKLVALTVPGVPDVYQGTELWSLDLVDPDNRRAVDYSLRRRLLDQLDAGTVDVAGTLADPDDPGLAKLLVVREALAVRRRHASAFVGDGASYTSIAAAGAAARHVVSFRRGEGREAVVIVAPRLSLVLARGGGWQDTTVALHGASWRNVFDGSEVAGGDVGVADLLQRFPVALLVTS
jgi:(1->4)-alpha-D-glucan 1-alpha-D-glucosylmutase